MIVDLHNHTALCNHAEGSMEEYVKKAIVNGTKHFGFSDHGPMNFDQKYRMSMAQTRGYEKSVLELKESYKNDINILLGYEIDFLEGLIEKDLLKRDLDYAIGSVHFINKWGFDNPEFIGEYQNRDIDEIWQNYFDAIEKMAKSSLFDIVGHLDLIKVFKFMPKKDIRLLARNAIKSIKESNMVVEINAAGFRKPVHEQYPSRELLEMIYETGIEITFASDAHKPEQVGQNSEKIIALAKDIGFRKIVFFEKREKTTMAF